jgi:hypothetical protein
MANTTNDIKEIILDVSQLGGTIDNLSNDSSLDDLNFNNNMCSDLCRKLNNYLQKQGSANTISSSEVTSGLSVQQIIDMVNQKL